MNNVSCRHDMTEILLKTVKNHLMNQHAYTLYVETVTIVFHSPINIFVQPCNYLHTETRSLFILGS